MIFNHLSLIPVAGKGTKTRITANSALKTNMLPYDFVSMLVYLWPLETNITSLLIIDFTAQKILLQGRITSFCIFNGGVLLFSHLGTFFQLQGKVCFNKY